MDERVAWKESIQLEVATPSVEVGSIRMSVVVALELVAVEDELVWREEASTHGAADAFGARTRVAIRKELSAASPTARMTYVERKARRKCGRRMLFEEGAHETFGLAVRDETAAPRRQGHCACASQVFELRRRALHTGDAERHTSVVNLVVTELLEKRTRNLRQAQPCDVTDAKRHNWLPVQYHCGHLRLRIGREMSFLLKNTQDKHEGLSAT